LNSGGVVCSGCWNTKIKASENCRHRHHGVEARRGVEQGDSERRGCMAQIVRSISWDGCTLEAKANLDGCAPVHLLHRQPLTHAPTHAYFRPPTMNSQPRTATRTELALSRFVHRSGSGSGCPSRCVCSTGRNLKRETQERRHRITRRPQPTS
jgi:hypothetical protein